MTKLLKRIPMVLWALLALFLVFTLFADGFIQPINLQNILKNTSILIIVAMGMTIVIISGCIDLSIGMVMSLSGMLAALYLQRYEDPGALQVLIAVFIGLAVGLGFGLFNGIMIGKFKFDYWLITFSSMSIAAGLCQVVSEGNIIAGFNKTFRFLGDGSIGFINTVVLIAAVIVAAMLFLTRHTRFGLHIFAVGDSEQCAHQSGINVTRVRTGIFVLTGLLAGFGGVLLASKTNSISPIAGKGYEFDAIAAAVVGGTSFDGGTGGVTGTILGALLIASMKNGLMLLGLSAFWQQTLIGMFILLIIVMDVVSIKRKKVKTQRRVYKYAD